MKATALPLAVFAIALALPASGAEPLSSYKLELVARPPFSFLSTFGEIKIDVYDGGVRAHNLVMDSYSKNGEAHVTVKSPLSRLYAQRPIDEIGETLLSLRANDEKLAAPGLYPLDPSRLKQAVAGIPATRFRVELGPDSWMDVWSTETVVANPQYRRLLEELVSSLGKDFSTPLAKITGTPIKVSLETRRFHKAVILEAVALKRGPTDEKEALSVGSVYTRAPFTRVFSDVKEAQKK